MKKILIALVLGLLLVSLIATPVFAKPTKGVLVPNVADASANELTATASASIALTHTGNLKVTIALRGAEPNSTYFPVVFNITGNYGLPMGGFSVTTNSKGNARGSTILAATGTKGDTVTFRVSVIRDSRIRLWWNPPIAVTF